MRLPISVAGALMPDAHVGYGLPIGGVLATENVVIPYAVGVDIACRMRLSIFPVSPILLGQKPGQFKKALSEQTRFGRGENWNAHERPDHEVLDDADWKATRLLRSLHDAAPGQLGTSGTGNHFVEWGSFELVERDDRLGLEPGLYLALLSHSGSRGIGFKIANLYSELAHAATSRSRSEGAASGVARSQFGSGAGILGVDGTGRAFCGRQSRGDPSARGRGGRVEGGRRGGESSQLCVA